jgi:hypothetical protein
MFVAVLRFVRGEFTPNSLPTVGGKAVHQKVCRSSFPLGYMARGLQLRF